MDMEGKDKLACTQNQSEVSDIWGDDDDLDEIMLAVDMKNLEEPVQPTIGLEVTNNGSDSLKVEEQPSSNDVKKPKLEGLGTFAGENKLPTGEMSKSVGKTCKDSSGRLTSKGSGGNMVTDMSNLRDYFKCHTDPAPKSNSTSDSPKTWAGLLRFLSLDKKTEDCLINQMNIGWIKESIDKLVTGMKVPFLAMWIFDDGRYQGSGLLGRSNTMTFMDETGSICGWVDQAVLKGLGDVLRNGASVAVRDAVVVNEKGKLSITLTKDSFQYIATEKMQFRELGVARKNDKMTELAFKIDATGVHILIRSEKLAIDRLASHSGLSETIKRFKKSIFSEKAYSSSPLL